MPPSTMGYNAPEHFWQVSLASVEARLGSGAGGLSTAEAAIRLARCGPNLLEARRRGLLLAKILGRFRNPLVLTLLVASSISAATGDLPSFLIIATIVLVSVLLDSLQEHRAERAAEKLKLSVALNEQVLRDGRTVTVRAEDLVPGDVVLLAAGDLVPADGYVIAARDFFVNEAMLTGESYPTEKHAAPDGIDNADLAGAANAAFMGTSAVSGSATMLVCATGKRTQLGEIAGTLRRAPPPAALEHGTYEFGLLIVRLTVLLVLFVLLVNLLFHRPLLESFLFALALAVGLTPELLPMVVSVTLARGALRMAKARVIVKRLGSIHDLGAMDVLCTDKTGTLTEARIRLARQVTLAGNDSDRVLALAWLNSHFQTGLRSPLDAAILDRGGDADGWNKIDEVPFDFERRRVSVLLERSGERILVVKGAPESVLPLASSYRLDDADDTRPLDADARSAATALIKSLGDDGYRVLAVAWRSAPNHPDAATATDECDLTLAGFAVFLDPPKETAGATIATLGRIGVSVKILTGDNEAVTRHVCGQLGLPVDAAITGAELEALSDEALGARVEQATLFSRLTPMQKNRVIMALKRRGHVVGFLGDGINDAPSLHTADVGISVVSAVDIAKDAADIILLEQDLGVLVRGVREGRRTFGNIMKYVMMGTSSNFGNMFSMAGATLVLPFLPMLPVQILLNNLLYDLSELPIPLDTVDEELMSEPRHWDIRFIRYFMMTLGPLSSLFDFVTFALLLLVFHADQALFHTGWFIESLASQVLVIFVIRTRRNPLRSRPAPLLAATSAAVVAAAVLLPYSGLGHWLGLVAPPSAFLLSLGGTVAVYLVLAEAVKRWFYRRWQPSGLTSAPALRSSLPLTSR